MHGLIHNHERALIWNVDPSQKLWFHYTDRTAARAIFSTGAYYVSSEHSGDRSGLHVCPYIPGSKTETELESLILDGTRGAAERLRACVVFAEFGDLKFVSDPFTQDGMRFLAAPGQVLRVQTNIVGWAAEQTNGGTSSWEHSLTLFDPAKLAESRVTNPSPGHPTKGSFQN
jgi:hypothetical protein